MDAPTDLRAVIGRCRWDVVLFALLLWLLTVVCAFALLVDEKHALPHSYRGAGEALVLAVLLSIMMLPIVLPPFLFSQALIAGLLRWVGTRVTARSCVVMIFGTVAATLIALAIFRLILNIRFTAWLWIGPLSAVLLETGVKPGQHWIISCLIAQCMLVAFSWWRLRHRPLIEDG